MIPIFIILVGILIADQFINRFLIKKWNLEVSEAKAKYVNWFHKYGDKILYSVSMVIMMLAILEFYSLRLFIFIGLIILFGFRALMEWMFSKDSKLYLLRAVTCGLSAIGSLIYGIFFY